MPIFLPVNGKKSTSRNITWSGCSRYSWSAASPSKYIVMAICTRLGVAGGVIANDDPIEYVAPEDGEPNDIRLTCSDGYLTMIRNGVAVLAGEYSQPAPIRIVGADNTADRLTVDLFGAANVFQSGLEFLGGAGADDVLTIVDSSATAVVHRVTGPNSGILEIDGIGVTYSGVESLAERWAPTIVGLPDSGLEGTELLLEASVPDSARMEILSFQWIVANGGLTVAEGVGPDFRFTSNDDGQYVVRVTATAEGFAAATTIYTLPVNNTAPVVDAGADQAATEDGTVILAGSFTDAGSADTHTIIWDFGDGSTVGEYARPHSCLCESWYVHGDPNGD